MGESRTELLAWLNDLSQLGITKIEHCGTGVAYCVVMDSIYRDVPLKKVKFNAKNDYEYISNFKVLQSVFDKHRIDHPILIEKLSRCKMQDNLEFLQWVKRYWDSYYPGGDYDALARRAASPMGSNANMPPRASATKGSANSIATGMKKTLSSNSVAASPAPKSARAAAPAPRMSSTMPTAAKRQQEMEEEYQRNMEEMTNQAMELKVTVDQVEKEREFYFTKLREIELFVQEQMERGGMAVGEVLEQIQAIMYKTEDGFEIPDALEDEEETF
ncbi:hypothetical protein HDU98_001716 [Podochytrium sp. JEL0797]|nr:hypothetical protein HDU98_001716 [Podochytrium sp. JEL0797]